MLSFCRDTRGEKIPHGKQFHKIREHLRSHQLAPREARDTRVTFVGAQPVMTNGMGAPDAAALRVTTNCT